MQSVADVEAREKKPSGLCASGDGVMELQAACHGQTGTPGELQMKESFPVETHFEAAASRIVMEKSEVAAMQQE